MNHGSKKIRRAGGPTGLCMGTKGQRNSWFKRLSWDATGNIRVAQIFFRTDEFMLDKNDREVIRDLAQHYKALWSEGWILWLTFVGCADARYREDYNKRLAEDRLNSVLATFKAEMKIRNWLGFSITKNVRGEAGMNDHPDHWAEDRRVDIIDTRKSTADAPKKVTVYTLQDFLDGRLFRTEMFFVPEWNRDWRIWYPLYYYIKDIEEKDYIHSGNEEMIPVSETDLDNMERLLARIAPDEMEGLKSDIKATGRKQAVRNCFLVEFRKAWPLVREGAARDYEKSDFRYFHEFMAVVLGKVDPAGYAKNSSSR